MLHYVCKQLMNHSVFLSESVHRVPKLNVNLLVRAAQVLNLSIIERTGHVEEIFDRVFDCMDFFDELR